jgi:predicted RecA/RadA family phage recombinase
MTVECATYKEGLLVDVTPTAAVAAGTVFQLPDGRAAFAPTAIAAGVKGAVQVKGIVKVAKVITQTMFPSNKVYWDTSASTCNLLHGGSTDFFLGTVVADASYTATTCFVNLNEQPAFTLSLRDGYASIPISTAGWPHIYGGGNSVGFKFDLTAEAQKLDALSLRAIATATPGILQALVCINLNGDDAAFDFNVGMADGTHATDADTITSSLFLHTDGTDLNLNFESDNAAAEVAATDSTLDAVVGTPVLITWDMRDWAAIKVYVNGLRVCDGTTGTSRTFTLAGVTGPLKLLAHMEKSSNDSPGNVTVMDLGFCACDAQDTYGYAL